MLNKTRNLYLASQFFRAMYFAWPIWYGYASLTLSPVQVGLFFSFLIFIQLISDIPTGAFADKYGRKLSAVIGNSLLIIAPLIIVFGQEFNYYLLASVFYGLGRSFTSGSLDALLYDSPQISESDYKEITAHNVAFFQSGLLISTFLSGFLYEYGHTLPFVAESLASLTCTILIMFIDENRTDDHGQYGSKSIFKTITSGMHEIVSSKFLRIFVLFCIPLSLILSISNDYLNEAAMIKNGIDPVYRGMLVSGTKFETLVILYLFVFKNIKRGSRLA